MVDEERIQKLEKSLIEEHRKMARPNRFQDSLREKIYYMDPASVLPAKALGVFPGLMVLDLCAAPGGKTLILAEDLFIGASSDFVQKSQLIANEISNSRRTRLKNTIRDYVSPQYTGQIRVTGHDATRWGLSQKSIYDRILVDAPCSGDRFHVKEKPIPHGRGRSKNLAIRQYSILASAWMALKSGGRLVYSTCTISDLENDGVIAKLIKRQSEGVSVIGDLQEGVLEFAENNTLDIEKTEHGFIVLPDRSQGAGPIFFALLEKP